MERTGLGFTSVRLGLGLMCLVAIFIHACDGAANPCSGPFELSGKKYNLLTLKNKVGDKDSTFTETLPSGGSFIFYFRICDEVAHSACQTKKDVSMCQTDTHNNTHDCGGFKSSTVQALKGGGEGFELLMTATTDQQVRNTVVSFKCKADSGVGSLQGANPVENPPLTYNFEWTSQYVCPGGGGGGGGGHHKKSPAISGGWIFIICLFSVTLLYFVGGVLYQKFKNNATGKDLIPNVGFWTSLPGLVKDGFVFTFSKIRGLFGGSKSYSEI
ncbi:Maintenance of telomere capping protein 6 [Balamuthia mandrillaris]